MTSVVKLSIIPLLLLTCCASDHDPMENYAIEIWTSSISTEERMENAIESLAETENYNVSVYYKGNDSILLKTLSIELGAGLSPDIIVVLAGECYDEKENSFVCFNEENLFRYSDYTIPFNAEMKEIAQNRYDSHFLSFAIKDNQMIGFPLFQYDYTIDMMRFGDDDIRTDVPCKAYSFALIQKYKVEKLYSNLPLYDYLKEFIITLSEQFISSNVSTN